MAVKGVTEKAAVAKWLIQKADDFIEKGSEVYAKAFFTLFFHDVSHCSLFN